MGIGQGDIDRLASGQHQIELGIDQFFRNGVVAKHPGGLNPLGRFTPFQPGLLPPEKPDLLLEETAFLGLQQSRECVELLKRLLLLCHL